MTERLTAILSEGLSRHPERRELESNLVSALRDDGRLAVVVVPNLYDLRTEGPAASALREIDGDMIVLSWMYPRGSHWILNFHGIDGQISELPRADRKGHAKDPDPIRDLEEKDRVIATRPPRDRKIYCLDLRSHTSTAPFLDEIRQIVASVGDDHGLDGRESSPGQSPNAIDAPAGKSSSVDNRGVTRVDDSTGRRWYPVIDYSRCTNCMECVDFCLFGVYGIDDAETILVELPDNCRKGCPACSRVCPERAIIFPQHKTPAIAGAAAGGGSMKIDLSQLFGASEAMDSAVGQAERERAEQLHTAGRNGAGAEASHPMAARTATTRPSRDELDDLIDELDDMDL